MHGQSLSRIRFDRNYAFVTLLAILDREVVREFVDKIQLDRLSAKPPETP